MKIFDRKIMSLFIFILTIIASPIFVSAQESILPEVLSNANWLMVTSRDSFSTDPDDTRFVLRVSSFFNDSAGRYKKREDVIFSELVVKIYSIYDENGKRLETWWQLEKEGVWYTVKEGFIVGKAVRDESGKLMAVVLTLKDKKGRELVQREVKRK